MIPPSLPVVPSPGDLAFQPAYVGEFMKDHIDLKIQKAPDLAGAPLLSNVLLCKPLSFILKKSCTLYRTQLLSDAYPFYFLQACV
jgi:hypothetical protein